MSRKVPRNLDRMEKNVSISAERVARELVGSGGYGGSPLSGTVYTEGAQLPTQCEVCQRDPQKMNSAVAECSHVDCPHRRSAWSDRPSRAELFKGPWPRNKDRDPEPLA